MWFSKLIMQFFFWIDKIVYNFIPLVYDLLLDIARTSVLTQADIADMADRIYKLLAIFMIFKVILSLITYVVNPDDFSDKSKGVAKLGTNIVISLSLLILTPYIFNYAYQIQTIILEDNSLATLIFGDDLGEDSFFNSAGDEMSYIAMQAFFTPNLSLGDLHKCTTLYEIVYDQDGNPSGKKFNDNCDNALKSLEGTSDDFKNVTLTNYKAGVEKSNLGLMFRQDMVLATAEVDGEEQFIMDYKIIFSTVVGVIIILLLITFCMDVAVRSLKLAFYQLIAPIPILSYIDPKSGKDGMFKKWYESCFKTFISLFIRLLALYFAIYIISKVADLQLVDIIDGSYKTGFFLYVFVIIGALMFAKQLPKILEGLGIKLDGDGKFTLNPLKKIEEEAAFGKGIKKAVGYSTRPVKGLATAVGVGARSLVTGQGLRGMGKAFAGAMKGEKFGKNWSSSYAAARERKRQVDEMKADGVSPWEVRKENLLNTFRGSTPAQKTKKNLERMENVSKGYDTIRSTVIAIDDVAKAQNNLVKGIESAGSSAFTDGVDARLSDGTVISGRGKTASQIYQEVLDGENKILDNRVIGITDGTATWSNSNPDAIANAQTTVSNTVQSMQAEIDSIKREIPGVKISDIVDKTTGRIQNVKATGKGAQGAKNALSSSTVHQTTVDKYTKKPKGSS